MAITSITVYRLRIPFHQSFRHALQERDESDAVIVKMQDGEGRTGYGESLPRPYVTGETTDSMIARICNLLAPRLFDANFDPESDTFGYLDSVRNDWCRAAVDEKPVVAWNAAFCCVELALLDWELKRSYRPLSVYLPPLRKEVIYSGVISADGPEEAAATAKRYRAFGLRQIKVKVGTENDAARLAAVRAAAGPDVELRGDANGAWSAEEAVTQLSAFEPFGLKSIEQPVAAQDVDGLVAVRRKTSIPVMVDESLVTLDQAKTLVEAGACDLFNIRLSKCAGIGGALAMMRLALAHGIGIQVGAQVGETGILSAAGRALAAHVPELVAAEGSFGSLLLVEDITQEDVAFGQGGAAPVPTKIGLGVTVNEETLERLAFAKIEIHR